MELIGARMRVVAITSICYVSGSNAQAMNRSKKQYTAEEVARHTKRDDAWIIVNGKGLPVLH